MATRVRVSKFRHVHGTASKERYDNVNSTASAADSNIIAGNAKYLALPWQGGGGPFVVHSLSTFGRLDAIPNMFQGHQGAVQDLDFSPFQDEVIASASEDCSIKVWNFKQLVEEGKGLRLGSDVTSEYATTLSGHAKKVTLIRWNPVASNILLSTAYDSTVRTWDVEQAKEILSFAEVEDIVQHMSWNYNGSLFATTCKDKSVRLIDPRANKIACKFEGHEGSKGARITFLGRRDVIMTIGFSKQSDRQMLIWDPRDNTKPVATETIDVASGTILPFFDPDTSLLYIGGKGDCNIRYYEIVDGSPHLYYVDQYSSKDPQRGMCMLPKSTCDVGAAEVAKILRLCQNSNNGTTFVETVSFAVPRKSDAFQEDLYPPTFSGKPSLTSAEWTGGATKDPLLVNVEPPGASTPAAKPSADTSAAPPPSPPPAASTRPPPSTPPAPSSPAPSPANALVADSKGASEAKPAKASAAVGNASELVITCATACGITLSGTLSVVVPSNDARIATLEERVKQLEAENAKLRQQLGGKQ